VPSHTETANVEFENTAAVIIVALLCLNDT